MKRVIALSLALIMVISVVPCMIFAASTETVIDSLGGEVLWSTPDGNFSGTSVATAFEGWSSTITSGNVDVNTYTTGNTLRYYNATYATADNNTLVVSPGYGQGSEKIIIEWLMYHDTSNDLYFDFSFRDINDTEIAFLKLDKNATEVGYSHPNSDTDYYALGYPDVGESCAIVAYNNPDGITHTADFYVAGEKVSSSTELEGIIDGFKSIESSNGYWTRADAAIGFTNLTIGSCTTPAESETIESVSYNNHVYMIQGTTPVLPAAIAFTGSEGTVAEGTIAWDEPDEYIVGDNTVTGTASVTFEDNEITQAVSLAVTCYPQTFALDDLSC